MVIRRSICNYDLICCSNCSIKQLWLYGKYMMNTFEIVPLSGCDMVYEILQSLWIQDITKVKTYVSVGPALYTTFLLVISRVFGSVQLMQFVLWVESEGHVSLQTCLPILWCKQTFLMLISWCMVKLYFRNTLITTICHDILVTADIPNRILTFITWLILEVEMLCLI